MHLSVARLCLDCQEIHDGDRCPVCTSEAFGFVTRWVKVEAPARRQPPRDESAAGAARVDTYRQILNPPSEKSRTARWLQRGGLLMAAGYLARLGWQVASQHRQVPKPTTPDDN